MVWNNSNESATTAQDFLALDTVIEAFADRIPLNTPSFSIIEPTQGNNYLLNIMYYFNSFVIFYILVMCLLSLLLLIFSISLALPNI